MTTESDQRQRVIEAAKSWLGTPYHSHGRIKGVGADCATLLAECYFEAGAMPYVDLGNYSPQWFLHRSEEKYVGIVLQHAVEIAGPPRAGDIAVYKIGRCFAHGAICITDGWPCKIIHAYQASGFVREANSLDGALALHQNGRRLGQGREVRFFSPWGPRDDGRDIRDQQPDQR